MSTGQALVIGAALLAIAGVGVAIIIGKAQREAAEARARQSGGLFTSVGGVADAIFGDII